MIPIEILRRVEVIYTHKNCPDGMASAMILKDAFRMLGMSPRIAFLAHGTNEHGIAGMEERALFCDIAPTQECADIFGGCETIIVLDHHKGAEEIVRSFGELGVFADEKLEPGVSGTLLAFRHVWAPAWESQLPKKMTGGDPNGGALLHKVLDFAQCVSARDTWQTEDAVRFQRGQWTSKMLMAKPASYWLDEGGKGRPLLPYLNGAEVEGGRCLFEAHEEAVRQAVEQCVPFDVTVPYPTEDEMGISGRTYRSVVFQEQACGFRLTSDVAEAIRKLEVESGFDGLHSIVAGFSYVVNKPGEQPVVVYSLRGLNGFDVATFAKANGGGGHTAAAGFSTVVNDIEHNPYNDLRRRLERFLIRPDPAERARVDCIQDGCENAPFVCVGGLQSRAELKKPHFILDEEWPAYRAAYEAEAERQYGPDWRTCEFSWKPAFTIESKP